MYSKSGIGQWKKDGNIGTQRNFPKSSSNKFFLSIWELILKEINVFFFPRYVLSFHY